MTTLAALMIMMMGVTACGNDSDDGKSDSDNGKEEPGSASEGKISASGLLGMWRCDWGDDPTSDYTAYYFEKGEQERKPWGAFFDKGNSGELFHYTFNESTQTVDIEYTESSEHETLSITDFKLNAMKIDGEIYNKSELTEEMILLGEWLFYIDPSSMPDYMSRVKFFSDGTYAYIDRVESSEVDVNFDSFADRVVYGRYYINNKNITFTGNSDIAGDYIIDALLINGMRLIRADHPNEHPYIIGNWVNR